MGDDRMGRIYPHLRSGFAYQDQPSRTTSFLLHWHSRYFHLFFPVFLLNYPKSNCFSIAKVPVISYADIWNMVFDFN